MKKLYIVIAVFVMPIVGSGSAQAATWEPNGEEQVVTLTPPSALHGCARVVGDIQGLSDVYEAYGDTQELVATWSVFQDDPKFFIATATLESRYYSLNNPLNPGRSVEATFWIPRCPDIETPPSDPSIDDVPLLPPNPDVPSEQVPDGLFNPVVPVQQIEIPEAPVAVEKPVEAPVTASTPVPAPSTESAVETVKEAPVVEAQAPPVVKEELAATGVNGGVVTAGAILLLIGLGCLLVARKLAK